MLNIPEQVKSLFNRDDIRKNIRITFPQSGRPDITNDNIAAETLSFTESVCSQSTFKYGLAEASVIEFETVGIANMLGETIEAWVEIDATTIPEELQTERDDLTFPVYPVPLGRFVVTACPRNHEAMAHRKVRAMSVAGVEAVVPANDRAIMAKQFPVYVNAGLEFNKSFDEIAIDWGEEPAAEFITTNATYTPTDVDTTTIHSTHRVPGLFYNPNQTAEFYSRSKYDIMPAPASVWARQRFQLHDLQPANYSLIIEQLADQLMEKYPRLWWYDSSGVEHDATRDDVINMVAAYLTQNRMLCEWQLQMMSGSTIGWVAPYIYLPEPTDWASVPTLRKGSATTARIDSIGSIHWSFSAYGVATSDPQINTYAATGENPRVSVETYDRPIEQCDALQALRFTLQTQPAGTLNGAQVIAFPEIEIMQTAALAYLELTGTFGNFSRDGGTYVKALDTEPAMQLTRAQYESAWWDEYDLAPVGAITYKVGSEDIVYQFGDGASVYKLNYDKVFETLKITSDQKINEILDVALVLELQKLMYTPVEIDAHGLPYLEAGDCIELEALDGTIIKTYVLRRQLTGIQYLTDQITADGITIAEVNV